MQSPTATNLQASIARCCPSAIEIRVTDYSFFAKMTSETEARALFTQVDSKMDASIRQRPEFWIVNGRA